MPEDSSDIIGAHVERAWQEFLAEADRRYPAADWPGTRLHERRNELLTRATQAAGNGLYRDAAELRATARGIGAILATRGDAALTDAAEGMKLDMARVIVGEGPEPRTVSSRHWETREKMDFVLNDPDANLTRLAEWSDAARHALHHSLTVETKMALGMGMLWVASVDAASRREPETTPEPDRDHGPDMG